MEITKGYEVYTAKIDNIKGMLSKVSEIFDTSVYENELNAIKRDVENDDFNAKKSGMSFDSMQTAYEFLSLTPYNERLDALENRIKKEVEPFYEMYLSTKSINQDINNAKQKEIEEIIQRAIGLVNQINLLEPHDNKQYNEIIDEAYKAIYSVIIKEASFGRSDVFDHVKRLNKDAYREKLSLLLNPDLKLIPENFLTKHLLDNMGSEGLSFDLLTEEVIKKIAKSKGKEKKEDIQSRTALAAHQKRETERIIKNDQDYIDCVDRIRDLKRDRAISSLKKSTLVMIPVLALGLSYYVGRKNSDNILLYRTSIRTVNCETGKVIDEERVWYDESKNTFTATILVNQPWEKRTYGKGYSRDVIAYEYKQNDKIDIEAFKKSSKEKYRYTEYAETIPEGENTEDATIYITSEYQDQKDSKKSDKYVLPFMFVGLLIAVGLDFLLAHFKVIDTYELSGDNQRKLREIDELILRKDMIAESYRTTAHILEKKRNEMRKTTF